MTSARQFASFLKALVKMMPFSLKGDVGQETVLNAFLIKALRGGVDKQKVKDALYYLVAQKDDPNSWQMKFINDTIAAAVKKDFIEASDARLCKTFVGDHANVLLNALRLHETVDVYEKAVAAEEERLEREADEAERMRTSTPERSRPTLSRASIMRAVSCSPEKFTPEKDNNNVSSRDTQVAESEVEDEDSGSVVNGRKRNNKRGGVKGGLSKIPHMM